MSIESRLNDELGESLEDFEPDPPRAIQSGDQWWRSLSDEERHAAIENMRAAYQRVKTCKVISPRSKGGDHG